MNYLTFFLENLALFLKHPSELWEYLGSFLSYRLLPILLNMSLTGALVILFVLLIRHYLLKKAPKIFSYALWAVVLFRLLCPVSFSSGFSLMSFLDPPALRSEGGTASVVEYIPSDIVHTEYPRVELPLMPVLSDTINETLPYGEEQLGADPLEAPMAGLTLLVWPAGMFALLLYSAVSYFKLRRKLVGAALLRDNIWLADHIGSPFVMGLFRPKIYLPSSLAEWERDYIILHEQHHIRRGDHIVKALSFFALCVHWFNPLVWVAFVLSGKDMEMSCDEAVIRKLGPDIRADYSRSLLSLATGRPIFSGTPLAFGEGDTGSRIKNLAGWKKSKPFVIAVSLILVVAVAIFCGANAAGFSWVKVTIGNGLSYDITLNLEEPIQSWAIYEDIYHEGELLSSTLRVSRSIPDYSGSAERRFTASLKLKENNMVSNIISCSFSGPGDREWQVALPTPKYGPGLTHWDVYDGSGRSIRNTKAPLLGNYYVHFRESLEDDGSIILSTTTFAPDHTKDYGGIVVQYRLVTSTDPEAPEEDPLSSSITPVGGADTPTAQTWLDAYGDPAGAYPEEEHRLSVAAFPGATFHWTPDDKVVARAKSGKQTVLIEGMPIWNVFLRDLNGDEKPEFCATISLGSGIIDERVIVYDYANGKRYELSDRMKHNYALVLDDQLCVVETDFFTGNITQTGMLVLDTDRNGHSALGIGIPLKELPLPEVSLLEQAVDYAIRENANFDPLLGLRAAASHITLAAETVRSGSCRPGEGYQGEQVTVYAQTLAQTYSLENGSLTLERSVQTPAAITLEKTAYGGYTLADYWTPAEGNGYEAEVRRRFPDHIEGEALNGEQYFPALMQHCVREVVDFSSSLDSNSQPPDPFYLDRTVNGLLDVICSSPAHSSNPGDYIGAHPEEYALLEGFGPYTLYYFFNRFLEGGETGLEGHVMWAVCEDIMRGLGEAFILDTVAMTGQDRFDRFHANARELARQYSSAELEQMYPGSFILLEMTGDTGADSEHTEYQPITVEFAPEHFLHTGNYHEFIADDSEYMTRLVFHPGEVLRNISFHSLQYELGTYVVSEELYALPALSPDKPLVTGVVFYGSMTTYGISFTDADGYARHFAVYTSGMDGSLILQEYLCSTPPADSVLACGDSPAVSPGTPA